MVALLTIWRVDDAKLQWVNELDLVDSYMTMYNFSTSVQTSYGSATCHLCELMNSSSCASTYAVF